MLDVVGRTKGNGIFNVMVCYVAMSEAAGTRDGGALLEPLGAIASMPRCVFPVHKKVSDIQPNTSCLLHVIHCTREMLSFAASGYCFLSIPCRLPSSIRANTFVSLKCHNVSNARDFPQLLAEYFE
jgi:hypothetical protein